MSLFRGKEKRGDLPLPIIAPFPGTGIYGQPLSSNPDTALQTSAVWACVGLIADIVAMLPLNSYQTRNGMNVKVPTPPLLAAPSSDTSLSDWLYMLVVSAMLRGNTYGVVAATDGYGRPTQIELQNPDRVDARVGSDGRVTYRVNGKPVEPWAGGVGGVGSLWHFRAFRYPGNPLGLSPITYAARTIGIELGASKFAADFFRTSGHPVGTIETEQMVDQTQATTIKERFMNAVRNREPVVLGAGATYKTLQVSPEESQFLATQQATATQIARYFRVPPEMIGAPSGNSMTYSNVEQRSLDLLTFGVQPWLSRIETALFALTAQPTFHRFDTSELLRTDLETRFKSHAIGIAGKFLTPDEARASEGLPPLTAAQKAVLELVPLTVSPMGTAKSLPNPPGGGAPADTPASPPASSPAGDGSVVVNNYVSPAEVHMRQPDVHVPVTVLPSEVRVPVNVDVPAPAPARPVVRRVERNKDGGIERIIEE